MDREGMDTKRELSSKQTISYKQLGVEADQLMYVRQDVA
jgi:hypothetical protein